MRFTQAFAEASLARLPARADGSHKLILDSQSAIPTMELSFTSVPDSGMLELPRSTTNRILAVSAGTGRARIGALDCRFERGDLMVVPSWTPCRIEAQAATLLFQASDEPVMRTFGFLREEAPATT
jgi:gentisate 1,2-dioxygenase